MKTLLLFTLIITGCTKVDFYKLDQITEATLKLNADDKVTLSFKLPLESLYYSPGLKKLSHNNKECYKVIRCEVNKECSVVDVKTTLRGAYYEAPLLEAEKDSTICLLGFSGKSKELSF